MDSSEVPYLYPAMTHPFFRLRESLGGSQLISK